MNYRLPLIGLVLVSLLLLSSCTEDPVFPEQSLVVNVSNLPQLEEEGYYELWFSYPEEGTTIKERSIDHGDQSYFSVGRFVIDDEGAPHAPGGGAASFALPEGINPNLLIDAIVTVQAPDARADDPGPRVLSGSFHGSEEQGLATLELSGGDAFGTALDSIRGTVRLETSVNAQVDQRPTALWFVDAQGNPGLELLVLPLSSDNSEWIYESWIVRETEPDTYEYISMGTFDDPDSPDSNGGGPGYDALDIPFPVPGEDLSYHGEPVTLNNGSYGVLVTLQPTNITLDRPFLPLLTLNTISQQMSSGQAQQLITPVLQPVVEIIVDR